VSLNNGVGVENVEQVSHSSQSACVAEVENLLDVEIQRKDVVEPAATDRFDNERTGRSVKCIERSIGCCTDQYVRITLLISHERAHAEFSRQLIDTAQTPTPFGVRIHAGFTAAAAGIRVWLIIVEMNLTWIGFYDSARETITCDCAKKRISSANLLLLTLYGERAVHHEVVTHALLEDDIYTIVGVGVAIHIFQNVITYRRLENEVRNIEVTKRGAGFYESRTGISIACGADPSRIIKDEVLVLSVGIVHGDGGVSRDLLFVSSDP